MFRSYTYWVCFLTLTFAAITDVNAVEAECKKTLVVSVAQQWPPLSYLELDHLDQVIGNNRDEIKDIIIKYHQRYGN